VFRGFVGYFLDVDVEQDIGEAGYCGGVVVVVSKGFLIEENGVEREVCCTG
jgi:hypothetical protein